MQVKDIAGGGCKQALPLWYKELPSTYRCRALCLWSISWHHRDIALARITQVEFEAPPSR